MVYDRDQSNKKEKTMAEAKADKAHDAKVAELAAAVSVVNDVCDSYVWPKPDKDAPERVGISGVSNAERLYAATNLVGTS